MCNTCLHVIILSDSCHWSCQLCDGSTLIHDICSSSSSSSSSCSGGGGGSSSSSSSSSSSHIVRHKREFGSYQLRIYLNVQCVEEGKDYMVKEGSRT